ncbi:uncharacterized protein EDB91DRAFT_1080613 [Suillus paluster]|uniref:uncharacterized protein n=1 Tax=Suillus paluster TaxID=48578 RepID=UPI001B882812|nr:uncharacterized protein EDB91DRAFT_1080613 [Suillus paluster]KAG1745119.1 hypothetical protein EDB91DRAFT_1080613 [Suillus paluster]
MIRMGRIPFLCPSGSQPSSKRICRRRTDDGYLISSLSLLPKNSKGRSGDTFGADQYDRMGCKGFEFCPHRKLETGDQVGSVTAQTNTRQRSRGSEEITTKLLYLPIVYYHDEKLPTIAEGAQTGSVTGVGSAVKQELFQYIPCASPSGFRSRKATITSLSYLRGTDEESLVHWYRYLIPSWGCCLGVIVLVYNFKKSSGVKTLGVWWRGFNLAGFGTSGEHVKLCWPEPELDMTRLWAMMTAERQSLVGQSLAVLAALGSNTLDLAKIAPAAFGGKGAAVLLKALFAIFFTARWLTFTKRSSNRVRGTAVTVWEIES